MSVGRDESHAGRPEPLPAESTGPGSRTWTTRPRGDSGRPSRPSRHKPARQRCTPFRAFEPSAVVQQICDGAVECLDLDLATVMVIDGGQATGATQVASSPVQTGEAARNLYSGGPSEESANSGVLAMADDIRDRDGRWNDTADRMGTLGLVGAHGFPLLLEGRSFGALTLYTGDPWGTDRSNIVGQTFADLVVLALTQNLSLARRQATLLRLMTAMSEDQSRIHQVEGVTAQVNAISIDRAHPPPSVRLE